MRIQQLDGVRAIAILMVLAEHGFRLKMGWAGVDLFFVLSGFLITRILRNGRERDGYWRSFYIKRAARIVPPLAVCLLLCALLFSLNLHWLWLAYIFFGANIAAAVYPDLGGPLSVLWSLAVEEHFYLIWPSGVRLLNRRRLIYLLTAVLAIEPVARGIATPWLHSYWPIYYLTPFRLDGLATGSLLALLLESARWRTRIASLAGPVLCLSAATLVAALARFHTFQRPANSIMFNSLGYALVTLVAAAFISYVLLRHDSIVTKVLCWRGLTLLGRISYGVYLFHPIFLLVASETHFWAAHPHIATCLALLALLVFGWLSFRFYETPWIRLGHRLAS